MTTVPYLDAFLNDVSGSHHTRRAYRRDLADFAAWFRDTTGEVPAPGLVTRADLRDWRDFMARRYRASTVNRKLAGVSRWLRWCHEQGHRTAPPPGVSPLRQQILGPRGLSRAEEARLVREAERAVLAAERISEAATFRAVRNLALVVLMLHAGLRVGEVIRVRLDDIERQGRKGWLRIQGKGRKERRVPLNKTARRVLERWLAQRTARRVSAETLFVGQRGQALDPASVRRIVADLARRAGVQATPHTLRHTFAHRLVEAGVGLEKIAALMGHASLNTTRRYVEPGERDLERAVEKLA